MLVTFLNASSGPVYIGSIYMSLDAGKSVTTRRTVQDLDWDYGLKALVKSGAVTLSFTKESADDAFLGFGTPPASYSNTDRPDASSIPVFTFIWNTSENTPQWSDGANWRDAEGDIT